VELRTERLLLRSWPTPTRDLTFADGWCSPGVSELMQRLEGSEHVGFGPWLVVEPEPSLVVGTAGFLGAPDAEGVVQLGYGIAPFVRGRGYAPEAARALVAWAFAQQGVLRVIARCNPGNEPSIRVLEKVGMSRTGERDGMLWWEAARPGGSAAA
jgi:ribosomal-protein-alanine N-acetyltransferase